MTLKALITGITISAAIIVAPTHAEIIYEGDPDAVAVCKAIVANKEGELRKAINRVTPRHLKMQPVAHARSVFRCNGATLIDFAIEMNSDKALAVVDRRAEERLAAR